MAMNVVTQMSSIETALESITGLRVYDYVPKNASPPFAFVDLPETLTYDNTKGRGTDSAVFPVFVAVGDVVSRVSYGRLAEYLNGTGAKSIRTVLHSAGLRRVASAEVSILTVAGVQYLAARFDTEVTA